MSEATGCPESDAYARHKIELHKHIRAGRIDWRWHRNPRTAADLEARLLSGRGGDGKDGEGTEGKGDDDGDRPAISPVLPLDRATGEMVGVEVEGGTGRGNGCQPPDAKGNGSAAAPATGVACRGGGEKQEGDDGAGDTEANGTDAGDAEADDSADASRAVR